MAEHDREWTAPRTPPGGVSVRNLRIELDGLMRRYGFTNGVEDLARMAEDGRGGTAVADLVRAEDHQRLNAPDRNSMRRAALAAVSASDAQGWTEQHRGAFVAFIMKACVPDGSGTSWVIPFASWAEAAHGFFSLYRDSRVWDQYWAEVQ